MSDFDVVQFTKTYFDRGSRPGDAGYNDLLRALRELQERLALAEQQRDQERHAFNVLQHDYAERERIHSEEMNRMSEAKLAAEHRANSLHSELLTTQADASLARAEQKLRSAENAALREELAALGEKLDKAQQLCAECGKGFLDDDWAMERKYLEAKLQAAESHEARLREITLPVLRYFGTGQLTYQIAVDVLKQIEALSTPKDSSTSQVAKDGVAVFESLKATCAVPGCYVTGPHEHATSQTKEAR